MLNRLFVRSALNLLLLMLALGASGASNAEFLDEFDSGSVEGWELRTGDGSAQMEFAPMDGYARILVDATNDRHNVWWAIIKRDIAKHLNMQKLQDPANELRVEARIRLSHAPRRVNFMINTQRTRNFHKQLREYDIPDSSGWHTISMTTSDLDAVPGDSLNVQLGMTDWGLDRYHLDLDYYRADIVPAAEAPPGQGEPLVYHPPVPELETFARHLTAAQGALINSAFPEVNFHGWHTREQGGRAPVLTVSANQWPILRWDFKAYNERDADGSGVLELTTQSVQKSGDYIGAYGEDLGMEMGKIRVFEIYGGDSDWQQDSVTFQSFTQGKDLDEVVNSQMIIDVVPAEAPGGTTYITLPRPVMQRLLEGRTRGLLIRPLGALEASFYASGNGKDNRAPTLHFTVR